jgi:hypothetical protein
MGIVRGGVKMMAQRVLRVLMVVMIPLTVLVGCKSSDSAGPADSTAAQSQNVSDSGPFDATCPTSNTTDFAKSKFVLHTGLAFGAFHRWIYRPYQAGGFSSGASGRVMSFVKAGAAALFVKHEVRLALDDAKASPLLCHAISAPLANIGNSLSGAVDRLKGGDPSGLDGVNSNIGSVENSAGANGAAIGENENADIYHY